MVSAELPALDVEIGQIFEDHGGRYSGDFFAQVVFYLLTNYAPGTWVDYENWRFVICDAENVGNHGEQAVSVLVSGVLRKESLTPDTINYIVRSSRFRGEIEHVTSVDGSHGQSEEIFRLSEKNNWRRTRNRRNETRRKAVDTQQDERKDFPRFYMNGRKRQ